MEWISAGDGKTLCLSGHPVQIVKGTEPPFELCVEGRSPAAFWNLAAAKKLGEERARELAEFTVA